MKHAPTLLITALAVALGACASKPKQDVAPPTEAPPPEPMAVDATVAPEPEPMPAEAEPPAPPAATKDVLDTIAEAGNFTTMLSAIEAAGLKDTLKGPGRFTLFAPDDEAFAKIPKPELDRLLKDKKKLANVLNYHIVSGAALTATEIAEMPSVSSVAGPQILVSNESGSVKLNGGSSVRSADIKATNGVVHVIDTVLKLPKKK
ncbi:MAG TPA: fasciclin domain-containing protein [Nannocystis sp.]|jgi:uncharacterized surface protein with fasciclin (FAS1) repeats